MATVARAVTGSPNVGAWLPLVGLPGVVVGGRMIAGLFGWGVGDWPAWVFMWMLAAAIYAGLKWLSFAGWRVARPARPARPARRGWDARGARAAGHRAWGYLLLWPGMNAEAFFGPARDGRAGDLREWLTAAAKLTLGVLLVFAAAPLARERWPLLAGWLGMAGVVFVLHFGLFHLLSLGWRQIGIDAPPIMNAPARSASLAEFWGRRWNLAFRDVAHAHVFLPLVAWLGPAGATMAAFFVSGVFHDLVISVPAGAAWGRPTLYFLIQGAGVLLERTRVGRRVGLGRGIAGRVFCAAVTLAPVCLLFPRPFIERVVLPMLADFGAL